METNLDVVIVVCRWAALAAGVPGLIVGLLLAVRPEIMKGLNSLLNKEIPVNKLEKVLDNVVLTIDDWVMLKPRLVGLVLMAISVFLVMSGYYVLLK